VDGPTALHCWPTVQAIGCRGSPAAEGTDRRTGWNRTSVIAAQRRAAAGAAWHAYLPALQLHGLGLGARRPLLGEGAQVVHPYSMCQSTRAMTRGMRRTIRHLARAQVSATHICGREGRRAMVGQSWAHTLRTL
jgi:hypothetical protein